MMPNTPVAYIDATGMHVPTADAERSYFASGFQKIFGDDIVLDNSTQDGQFVGLLSDCLHDVNSSLFSNWQSMDPAAAVGVRQDTLYKLNGLMRALSTFSTAPARVVGQAGTVINGGAVSDDGGNVWTLPAVVVIPDAGEIATTLTCTVKGAIAAKAGTINQLRSVEKGWQSCTNTADAALGAPVEIDPQFYKRQQLSTAISARDTIDATIGAIMGVPGVVSCVAYENSTDVSDENGLPPKSWSFVVDGGDGQAIANIIRLKKGGGVSTYGDQVFTTYNQAGIPRDVSFFRPKTVNVAYYVTVKPLQGWTIDVQTAIKNALVAYTNDLTQGTDIARQRAGIPAQLYGSPAAKTFILRDLKVARDGLTPVPQDVALAFYERPACTAANVLVTTTKV